MDLWLKVVLWVLGIGGVLGALAVIAGILVYLNTFKDGM